MPPKSADDMILITLETPPTGQNIVLGQMVTVSVVQSSNIIKDVRELITNALGGRMRRYEKLLQFTIDRGMRTFRKELAAQGYDGALGVRFAHPSVVQGGVELVVYGTGFHKAPNN